MLQAAIIGYGGMGKWHHEAISQQVKGLEVRGVYDVRQEANDEARDRGLRVYEKAQNLFTDPEIALVIIATPNDSHKDYIIQGLNHGMHVVCEKPVVLNANDLTDIIEVSKKSPGIFTIHQNRRWDKDFQVIKAVLAEDIIGKPYFIESRVNGSSVFLHGWRDYKINGGGMLYDWGVHLVDQALQLIPEKVTSVTAHIFNIHSHEVDDNIKLLLSFESGLSVLLEVATNCFIPGPRWHVSGRDGTLVVHNWACDGAIVKLADRNALKWDNDIVYTAAGPTRTMAPRPVDTTVKQPLPEILDAHGNVYHRWSSADIFYRNLLDVIEGKAELYVKPEEALRVIQVMETALESAEKKQGLSCLI